MWGPLFLCTESTLGFGPGRTLSCRRPADGLQKDRDILNVVVNNKQAGRQ